MEVWNPIEWVAAIVTLVNVVLVIRADIRNFPFGIASVLLYGWVFYQAGFYANTGLQVLYYLPMNVIGWWVWLKAGPKHDDDLPVTWMGPRENAIWAVAAVAGTFAAQAILSHISGAKMALPDSFTTAASVVGQIMLARKKVENWIYWVVVNVVYAFYLLPSQQLWASTALYAVLLVLAVVGFFRWKRAAALGESAA